MRVVKIVIVALALALVVTGASAATPVTIGPTLTAKIALPSDYDDIAQIIGSGTSWLVVGNIDKSTILTSTLFPKEASIGESDGYVAMLDPALHLVWSHRFGTSHDDVATAIARDSAGIIWSVGVTTKEVQPAPISTSTETTPTTAPTLSPATPVPTANPDGVVPVTLPTAPAVADQLLISSWSSAGQLLSQSLHTIADGIAINPSTVIAAKSGIYVVGTAVDALAGTSRGFYVHVAKDGSMGPIHWIGLRSVVLRTAALLRNGSLVVGGSIAEALKGKRAVGLVDAFVAVVNPTTGSVLRTQRSGDKSATRSWESLSVDRFGDLMVIGLSQVGVKSQVVATSFSSKGAVRFSLRFANPLGTQVALTGPVGAFTSIALASTRPRRSGREAYLLPIASNGRLLAPTYLVGKAAGSGLVAAAIGRGYLLAVSEASGLTLAWFAPRIGK